jgi:hypothetical protein
MRLIRHRPDAVFVTFAQLGHQMLKVGRQTRGVRAKIPLQPFPHSIANRSAGLAIDLFAVVGDSTVHDEFRILVIARIAGSSRGDGKCFQAAVNCALFW